jgi:hypothetical protein
MQTNHTTEINTHASCCRCGATCQTIPGPLGRRILKAFETLHSQEGHKIVTYAEWERGATGADKAKAGNAAAFGFPGEVSGGSVASHEGAR